MWRKLVVMSLAVVFLMSFAIAAPITIHFWHAMSGKRLNAVNEIVNSFNASHPNIKVVPLFTGTYAETLTKAIAAYRAGNPPDIVQVYEVGFQTMLDSGAIVPVFDILKGFNFGNIVGPILRYYSYKGKLYAMPFNSSTAMLYYNKDAFRKAGLDPNKPPTTFEEVYEDGLKIVKSGAAQNGITFGWPAWIFEQMFAYHDQLYANNENGRGEKKATKLNINGPFGVKVLSEWMKWRHDNVLLYGGREYSANQAFLSGQSAMLIQSTSSLASIESAANFEVGTAFLPKMPGYPTGNSVIGGATLWVMKGLSAEKYKAIAEFLKYVAKTETTIKWHNSTGYFPITNAAVKVLLDTGSFCKDPNSLTAFLQILTGNVKDPAAIGVRLGGFVQIRDVVDSAIETAMQYKGTNYAQEAKKILDNAEAKANRILENYVKLYGDTNK